MNTYKLDQIDEVVNGFKNHEIIAFPTDTVYGVGVMYGDLNDLDRLKNIKNRPETKPIPMMVSSIEEMKQIALVDERTEKIVKHFLPGALTLVLPVSKEVDSAYNNGLDTVAVRIPEQEFVLNVISKLKKPLLVSSANQSGKPTALTSDDVLSQLPNIEGLVLGKCKELEASTIVDLTKDELVILRQGPITLEELKSVL